MSRLIFLKNTIRMVEKRISAYSLPQDTTFKGIISKWPEQTYKRIKDGVICLDDPGLTWTDRTLEAEFPDVRNCIIIEEE